jgi:hypothetical protein
MDEDVLAAVVRRDEAVTFGGVVPFDSAGSHFQISIWANRKEDSLAACRI